MAYHASKQQWIVSARQSILKNLRTLHIRMKKHSENAMFLAERFENDGLKVKYPGLKSHKTTN